MTLQKSVIITILQQFYILQIYVLRTIKARYGKIHYFSIFRLFDKKQIIIKSLNGDLVKKIPKINEFQ
jgi:hypothetical protein